MVNFVIEAFIKISVDNSKEKKVESMPDVHQLNTTASSTIYHKY